MKIQKKNSAPRYTRKEGIVSYLLTSSRTCNSKHVTTTYVEIKPNGQQRIHTHEPEEVYYILEGKGLMTVGKGTESVGPGDCIFIPKGASHGLENNGDKILKYFSAAAPMFTSEQLKVFWDLESETKETNE